MDGITFNPLRENRIERVERVERVEKVGAINVGAVKKLPSQSADSPQFQGNFQQALENAINRQTPLHFSKHANMRLNDRQITLTGEQMNRLENGLVQANAKGIKDSLVLVDDVALVVNVKSKTVITALERGQNNVFSNIDGAVIV
ncbi:MAG: flagellar biosynthesis protein [Firmicutes bacterium]|nr:flagellar biosynthesis protein [Bacillota bacterium]